MSVVTFALERTV